MRLSIAITVLGALAAFQSACSGDAGGRDDLAAPTYIPVEELRIGSADDPDELLTSFSRTVIGPSGEIFVPQRTHIRVYSAAGEPLGTFGREGSGPGEFSTISAMGMLADSLWAFDFRLNRFTYLDADGQVLRTVSIPLALGDPGPDEPPRPSALLADGSITGARPLWSDMLARGEITEYAVVRLSESGGVIDTLYHVPVANQTWGILLENNRGGSFTTQPFADNELVEHSPFASEVVRVDRRAATGPAGTLRLARVTLDGDTVVAREYLYRPLPVTPQEVDSIIDARVRMPSRLASEFAPGAYREAAERGLYVPENRPPVEQLVIGRDGKLWLQLSDVDPETVEWLALSPEGDPVGRAKFPQSFTMTAADGWTVWGRETDALEVPQLVRYTLERT